MKPIDKTTSSLEGLKGWLTDVSIVIVGIRKKLGKAIYAPDRLELEELLKHYGDEAESAAEAICGILGKAL